MILFSSGCGRNVAGFVYDNETKQPLQSVSVTVGGKPAESDALGTFTVTGVTIGKQTVSAIR
jgi:hypothetical protein